MADREMTSIVYSGRAYTVNGTDHFMSHTGGWRMISDKTYWNARPNIGILATQRTKG